MAMINPPEQNRQVSIGILKFWSQYLLLVTPSIYLQTLMLISKVCKRINEQLIAANELLTVMQEHTQVP